MDLLPSSAAMEAAEPAPSTSSSAGAAAHFRHRHPSFALKYPYLNPLPSSHFRRPSPPRKRSSADRRPYPHDELRFRKMPMLFHPPYSASARPYPYADSALSRSRLDSAAAGNPNLASALRPVSRNHHLEGRRPVNFVAAAPVNPNPNSALSCPLCQKEFQSVRALGGHMRIHGGLHGPAAADELLQRQLQNPPDPHEPTAAAAAAPARNAPLNSKHRPIDPAAFPAFPARSSAPSTAAAAEASSPSAGADDTADVDEADLARKAENQARVIDSANTKDDGDSMTAELFCDEQLETESWLRVDRPQRRFGYVSTAALRHLREDDDDDDDYDGRKEQRSSVFISRHHRQTGTPSFTYGKSDGDLSPETQCSCRTCGKTFFSQKALHGHMRCHRSKRKTTTTELLYRINEEEEEEQGGHEGMDIDDDDDDNGGSDAGRRREETRSERLHFGRIGGAARSQAASFWQQKSRRAPQSRHSDQNHISKLCKAIAAAIKRPPLPAVSTIDEDDGVAAAAVAADQPERAETIDASAGEEQSEASEIEQDLRTSGEVDAYIYTDDEMVVAEALLMLNCSIDVVDDEDPSMGAAPPLEDATEKAADSGGFCTARSGAAAANGGGYECVDCQKSFSSPQALGGHRSSSHKAAAAAAAPLLNSAAPAAAMANLQGGGHHHHHECSVCLRVFPTGQALGGHKRCHWNGPAEESSMTQMNGGGGGGGGGGTDAAPGENGEEAGMERKKKKIWMIDLNLPAPTESEDEMVVVAGGGGGAAEIEGVAAAEVVEKI